MRFSQILPLVFTTCTLWFHGHTAMAQGPVQFNEIMFHPDSEDVRDEFIELTNTGATSVNLAGWKFVRGVTFEFPDITLAPGDFLVVAADTERFILKYPGANTVTGNWIGTLSNSGETIELQDASGGVQDRVRYADEGDWAVLERGPLHHGYRGWDWVSEADGLGKSLERITWSVPANLGFNWGSSTEPQGTPGRPNSIATASIAPIVSDPSHRPIVPRSRESVVVSALIRSFTVQPPSATLHYRVDSATPGAFTQTEMFDDGRHEDGAAGDGIFAATIPPHDDGTIVQFFIEASGRISIENEVNALVTRRFPPRARQTDGTFAQTVFALYQVDDAIIRAVQPFYRLIMTEIERAELARIGSKWPDAFSDAQMFGTFISLDGSGLDLRYLAGFKNRGHGSRGRRPNNYRVNFRSDDPWHGVRSLNLNAQYPFSQHLGSAVCQAAGLFAADTLSVQVRVNGDDLTQRAAAGVTWGSYAANEVLNGDYTNLHFGANAGGNIYRCIRSDETPQEADLSYIDENPDSYRPVYSKSTNESEDDWTDLIELCRVLSTAPDDVYVREVERVADVDDWLRHLAVMAIMDNRESGLNTGNGDDYALYRGTVDTRFKLIPYDLDSVLGLGRVGANPNAGLFNARSMPAFRRLLTRPEFAPRYHAILAQLLDTVFVPDHFDLLVDRILGEYVPSEATAGIKEFVSARTDFIRTLIPDQLTAESDHAAETGVPVTTDATVALRGMANVIRTRTVRVNGQAADWDAWTGEWTAPETPLRPGMNRLLVQAFDAENSEIDRAALYVWRDPGDAGTAISGAISGDAVWNADISPVLVEGPVTVSGHLSIEPGTTVIFSDDASLTVAGSISAEGTDAAPIHLSGRAGSVWNGLQFTDNETPSLLRHVVLSDAGGIGAAIRLDHASVYMDHLDFRNLPNGAIHAVSSSFELVHSITDGSAGDHLIVAVNPPGNGEIRIVRNRFTRLFNPFDVIRITSDNPETSVQILQNEFGGGPRDGVTIHGTNAFVDGNVFTGFQPETAAESSAALRFSGTASVWMSRNRFTDNNHAVVTGPNIRLTSRNNTYFGSASAGVLFEADNQEAVFVADIFWNNATPFAVTGGGAESWVVSDSLVDSPEPWPGENNLNIDPKFVAPPTDLRLRPDSPARTSGPFGTDRGAHVDAGPRIANPPPPTTHRTDVSLQIHGPGISHYRFTLDDGPESEIFPVDTPLTISGLPNGPHVLTVSGGNPAGAWSPAPDVARVQWIVDRSLSRIVLSEILASNRSAVDVDGAFPDLIELHNNSASAADLSGLSLSDDPLRPRQFVFPPGTSLDAGAYLVVRADTNPGPTGFHTGFGLSADGDQLRLHDRPENGGTLMDQVIFGRQLPDRSISRFSDGSWLLSEPTFGSANRSLPVGDPGELRINEWLAAPRNAFPDDFIELHNPSLVPIELGDLHLTDNPLAAPALAPIPPLSFIESKGFAVFRPNGVQLPFRLSSNQGMIGLFTADLQPIDVVIYNAQFPDVSEIRSPDGSIHIVQATVPTPGTSNPPAAPRRVTESTPTIAWTDPWRFDQSGLDLGGTWTLPDFNDSAWPDGNALFHVGVAGAAQPLNTALEFTAPQQSTFYFRTAFDFQGDIRGARAHLLFLVDDGMVMHLNGREFYRYNLPRGNVTHDTPASFAVGTAQIAGPLTLPLDSLAEGGNILAVEVHRASGADTDVLFGIQLDILAARSIVPPRDLVLNELLAGAATDWVELKNNTHDPINLTDMSLTDDIAQPRRWVFPPNTVIPPDAYLSVTLNELNPPSGLQAGFSLRREGDGAFLFDRLSNGGGLLDSIRFGPQTRSHSIGRVPDGSGPWRLTHPTRNTSNQASLLGPIAGVRINEWMARPASGDDWFELYNPDRHPVDLSGATLTDDPAVPGKSGFPPLSFLGGDDDGGGFLQLLADGNPLAGPHHVDFRLAGDGESIAIFDSLGSAVDIVRFGPQTTGVSEGRFPDGSNSIAFFPNSASPEAPNRFDRDADGMPDAWEIEHGLNPDSPGDAHLDPDGDGATNLEEFQAGTDPHISGNRVRIDSISIGAAGVTLRFQTRPNQAYTIEQSAGLSNVEWTPIRAIETSPEPAIRTEQIGQADEKSMYYRIRTE